MNNNIARRIERMEKQLAIGRDDDFVEFSFGDGRIVRSTRREFDDFAAWLSERDRNVKETIEAN